MAAHGIKSIKTLANPLDVVNRMDHIINSLSDFDSKIFLEAIEAFKNGDAKKAEQLFYDAQEGVDHAAMVDVDEKYVIITSFDGRCDICIPIDSNEITVDWYTPTLRQAGILVERFKDDSSFLMISPGERTWENGADAMKMLERI